MEKQKTITASGLHQLMGNQPPDYSSRGDGFIVVNTLGEEHFEKEHIPRSINVPHDSLDLLKQSFDKSKCIIVYCASEDCESSAKAAEKLSEMGFENVTDFEGGLEAWKKQGGETVSGKEQAGIGIV